MLENESIGQKDIRINPDRSVTLSPEETTTLQEILKEETATVANAATESKAAAPERATRLEAVRADVAATARERVADPSWERTIREPVYELTKVKNQGPFVKEHTVTTKSGQTINLKEFVSTQAAYDHYNQQLEAINQASVSEKVMNWRQRNQERGILRESLAALRMLLAQEAVAPEQTKKIG